jgi:hypothetical protein
MEMTPRQELHRYIIERLGGCWHNFNLMDRCICGTHYEMGVNQEKWKQEHYRSSNPDLDSPDGFMWVWGKMRGYPKRWNKFIRFLIDEINGSTRTEGFYHLLHLIDHPSRFIDTVGAFLKEGKG